MANYHCSSRTNYFLVNDAARFHAWAGRHGLHVHASDGKPGHFALLPRDSDDGAFPSYDAETETEIDFPAELAGHLHEDSVAIIMETGAENLRYLHGHAVAIDASGKRVEISLDQIYLLAARRFPGKHVTEAEY